MKPMPFRHTYRYVLYIYLCGAMRLYFEKLDLDLTMRLLGLGS
jgi:hypothetical protein